MNTFKHDGLNLAYDDIANTDATETVVLIHGFASNRAENWRRLGWYGAFERRGTRVVALDLRGHGESDKPHEAAAYDRAAMAGDILALMDHLDIQRADLLGYSMGCRMAILAATASPERVGNLILGGVGERLLRPSEATPGAMTLPQAMRSPNVDAISEPTLRGFRQFAENQGEDLLALAACAERDDSAVIRAAIEEITRPTLVVAGALDHLSGAPQPLAEAIPGAKAVAIPGCDHFTTIPHALFKAACFDFLDGWEED